MSPYSNDLLHILVHEFGHCIGLGHSPALPLDLYGDWYDYGGDGRLLANPVWGLDSTMQFNSYSSSSTPVFDDGIGASLLRPRPGWLETTGSVYGSVVGRRETGVPFMLGVLAQRIRTDGSLGGPVYVGTNHYGHFVIEGLHPGLYVLMAYNRATKGADSRYDERSSARHPGYWYWEAIRLAPVAVQAGERTGPLVLTVRPLDGLD